MTNTALSDDVLKISKHLNKMGMTTLIMSDDKDILGLFGIADALRGNSKALIADLKAMGIKETIMLTGDQSLVA